MPLTQEQKFRFRLRQEQEQEQAQVRKAQELTHLAPPKTPEDFLRMEAQKVFSVGPGDVDLSEPIAGLGTRYGEGFLADTTPEAVPFYAGQYPGAEVKQVGDFVGVRQPGGPVQFTNLPGLDMGDVAATGGAATLPLVAGGAAALTRNPGAVSAVVQPLTELVREGVQGLAGTQRETPLQYGTRAGLALAGEVVPPGLVTGIRKVRSAMGNARVSLEGIDDSDLADAMQWAKEGFSDAALMNYQTYDNEVMKRLAKQILSLSGKEKETVRLQLEGLRNAYHTSIPGQNPPGFTGPPDPTGDWPLQETMARNYEAQRDTLMPPPQTTTGGRQIQQRVQDTLKSRKKSMQGEYDKMDSLVAEWNPKYDLSRAKASAQQRRIDAMPLTPEEEAEVFGAIPQGSVTPPLAEGATATGEPLGDTWYKQISGAVNVADPGRKLARVNALLGQIDPRQDYQVVKELRTRVGQILNLPLAQRMESGVDVGKAKEMYKELSAALEDPRDVIPGAAKGLRQQAKKANTSALNYYDTYDQQQVRQVLTSQEGQTPTSLYNQLANNPSSWEPEFRRVLDEGDAQTKDQMRAGIDTMIRNSDNPLGTLEKWRKSNVEALDWVYPDKGSKRKAYQTARAINDLNRGISKQAWETASEKQGFGRYALEERYKTRQPHETEQAAARRLVSEVGGPGSIEHRSLRASAMSSAFENAIKTNERYSTPGIEPKAFSEGIEELKNKGWWTGVLTSDDRKSLNRMKVLSERIWSKGDAGTALTLAAQVGQLRGSSGVGGMLDAAGSIALANRVSFLLTAKESPTGLLLSYIPKGKQILTADNIAKGATWANRALRSEYPVPEDATETAVAP